ncbi:hypothetical protein PW52_02470 [Tamlana sedimentorum]|uniref:RING-type E3 ubiquitin transferase n=1 Tax=Neotamlana sedimentorum TaxID=1435349 RepID=A0A0D7WBI0_9FLAO|nr:hypothetical protein [Tamlana sedimentorum]KJD36535.1 hypothetical protein PW52_02470 [Tamlana sedimentorum]
MAQITIIIIFFIITAAIIIATTYFNSKNTVLRQLKTYTPKSSTQFKTNQPTKISGTVLEVSEPFIAPYTKRPCIAYIFEVKERVSNGKHTRWKTLIKKEDIQDFFIETKGDQVMIKPTKNNYLLYMEQDHKLQSGFFNKPNENFAAVLKTLGVENKNWFGINKSLKYTERIIEIGETITVGGISKLKSLSEPIEGYNYSKIATLESSETHKLIITDSPKAKA